MNISYVTTYDAQSLTGSNNWSGTGYYIAKALESQSIDLNYISLLDVVSRLFSMRMQHVLA